MILVLSSAVRCWDMWSSSSKAKMSYLYWSGVGIVALASSSSLVKRALMLASGAEVLWTHSTNFVSYIGGD